MAIEPPMLFSETTANTMATSAAPITRITTNPLPHDHACTNNDKRFSFFKLRIRQRQKHG